MEYNNWALALQVQPAQSDDEVKAVVHDVYMSGKSARGANNDAGIDGSVDVDAYMTSQVGHCLDLWAACLLVLCAGGGAVRAPACLLAGRPAGQACASCSLKGQ